jgi:basic membrane protein A and related proteins
MRNRAALGVLVLVVVALAAGACGGGATADPKKIGLVTDVGQLEDKSFNEAAWLGVQDAAAEIEGATFDNIVTKDPKDYQVNMKTFVDKGFGIIVTSGFALGNDTTIAAKKYPTFKFIGTDQFICVTKDGEPDTATPQKCEGDAKALLPNYEGLVYSEAQAGFLAGIIAASLSKTGTIGTVGGINTIPPVVSYIQGYKNGAASVNPDIKVLAEYSSTDITKAFNDPAKGKAIAQQMIGQGADVLFQVAGLTGQGVLEAACDANLLGIGVDVDQYESLPQLGKCLITSAEKKLRASVKAAILRAYNGTSTGGVIFNNAGSDPVGIGLAPYHDLEALVTPEIQAKVDEALAAMKNNSLDPCAPLKCTPTGE